MKDILPFFILISGLSHIGFAIKKIPWGIYLTKPLTMILIIGFGFTSAGSTDSYGQLILWGLCFSLLGDIFLMLPRERFIEGLGSFFVAHLFYIAAFMDKGFLSALGALCLLPVALVLLFVLWPGLSSWILRVLVPVYTGTLLVMVSTSLGVPSSQLPALGALCFAFSDSCLALRKFRNKTLPYSPAWVMGSYFLAQWLITLSIS